MVFFPSLFSKAIKLSQASDKQKRINELLNASHNSQAERDYLRGQILKIFEEDEKALEDMAKDVPPRQRKPGRSQSIDGVNSRIDEGNMSIATAPDPTFIVVKKSKTLSVRLCKSD